MFPFYNNYPGTDLHEIDLAYILKLYTQIGSNMADLMRWKSTHESEYEQLKHVVDGLINSLVDVVSPWDSSIAYSIFSIVEYQGTNYIAVQDVPVGIMITNTDYWQPANTVIEQVNAIGAVVNSIESTVNHYATFADVPVTIEKDRLVVVGDAICKVIDRTTANSYTFDLGTNTSIQIVFTHTFYKSWAPDADIADLCADLLALDRHIKVIVDTEETTANTIYLGAYLKLDGNKTGRIISSADPAIDIFIPNEDVPTEPYEINTLPYISDLMLWGDGTNTLVKLSDRSATSEGANKSGMTNCTLYNFKRAIQFIPMNNYIYSFDNVIFLGVRNEQTEEIALYFGDGTGPSNSGERYTFYGCVFSCDTSLYCDQMGTAQINFVSCSFDFFTKVIDGNRKFYFPVVFTACHFETDRSNYSISANDNDVSMNQCDFLYNMASVSGVNEFSDYSVVNQCVFNGSAMKLPPRVYTGKVNNDLSGSDKLYALPTYKTFEFQSDTVAVDSTHYENDQFSIAGNDFSHWTVSNIETPFGKAMRMIALDSVQWAMTLTPKTLPTVLNGLIIHPIISTDMNYADYAISVTVDGLTTNLKRSYFTEDNTNYNVTWYTTRLKVKDISTLRINVAFYTGRTAGEKFDFGGLCCVLF